MDAPGARPGDFHHRQRLRDRGWGYHINLLDTPGHQDFSEETYRTLMAVDSVVMVLDSAKGVEPRTEGLFQVCRRGGLPVVMVINKLDRFGRKMRLTQAYRLFARA